VTLKYLLDTAIVSAPIAGKGNTRVSRRLTQLGARCAIAAPVWHELLYGTRRLPAGARQAALEEYLNTVVRPSFPILAYDDIAATWHAEERARLERLGRVPPFMDGQIAAIAFRHELTLVTANTHHFSAFNGLSVVDWTK
jgi:tRNA(fMet)-specific endonuclease VapC